jgi:hypothetical protein
MTYQLSRYDGVILIKDNERACIPFDPDNTDYQAYLKWLAEGNTPEAADAATLPAENA